MVDDVRLLEPLPAAAAGAGQERAGGGGPSGLPQYATDLHAPQSLSAPAASIFLHAAQPCAALRPPIAACCCGSE